MGEFEEVGNTVKTFASDNATVVVGTVIDQSMDDQIRVTVVATGIGSENRVIEEAPSLVSQPEEPDLDYKVLERPTVIRKQPEPVDSGEEQLADPDYLDIPAFLRRQAD
jgi:cell division protein FtsZ